MPRVIIAAANAERVLANAIAEELKNYVSSVGILADEPRTAQQSVATTGALVIVAADGWLDHLEEKPVLYDAVVQALSRSDLLVHIALPPGGEIPAVTTLPEPLRPLAYMQSTHVNPDETFQRDVRRIGLQLAAHLNRTAPQSTAPESATEPRPSTAKKANRGLPWHITIIATAFLAGFLFILIPNLRGDHDDDSATAPQAAPMSSAPNAAIITPRDGLMIGVGAGLTGQVADTGTALVNGVRLAVMGRDSVTVDGQTFSIDLLTQDAGCTPEGGIQAAETFTTDFSSMPGVIGHMCNVSCFPASDIYDENNLATISPACDAPGLTGFDSFNRTVPSAAAAAEAAAIAVRSTLGVTTVAVISDEEVIGKEVADAFTEAFTTAGGSVVLREAVSSRTLEPDALATAITAADPDLVFFGGRVPAAAQIHAALLIKLPDTPFMVADTVDLEAFLTAATADTNNVLTFAAIPPQNDNITVLTERYTATFDSTPPNDTLIHAYAYDATNILLNGVEAVGEVDVIGNLLVDRTALQVYLREYMGNGIMGRYECVGTGDCSTTEVQLLSVNDGALSP